MTKTAVVIDDDPISLCVLSDFLEGQGWTVYRALSVRESFVFCDSDGIDALFIDDHLPDGDFDDIAAAWRECRKNKALPWMIRMSSAEAPRSTKSPWNIFVVKPWTNTLVASVLNVLEGDPSEGRIIREESFYSQLPLFDQEACEKAFAKHPRLWFRVRDGIGRRLPLLLKDMGESCERRDRGTFQHLAHEICGMFKMLRSHALAERASDLEKRAETAQWDDLLSELRLLKANIPQLQELLDDFGQRFANLRDLSRSS